MTQLLVPKSNLEICLKKIGNKRHKKERMENKVSANKTKTSKNKNYTKTNNTYQARKS